MSTSGTRHAEAHEHGVNAGWAAANYADAYGGAAASDPDRYDDSVMQSFYESGFEAGVQRFADCEWSDGSWREDDE